MSHYSVECLELLVIVTTVQLRVQYLAMYTVITVWWCLAVYTVTIVQCSMSGNYFSFCNQIYVRSEPFMALDIGFFFIQMYLLFSCS